MGCVKCGSDRQKRVKSVILVVRVERQRELEVTALHCQQCGFLEISASPDAIPADLTESLGDGGRPN
jgi:Zn ribbon nucleic-acid-binding protein